MDNMNNMELGRYRIIEQIGEGGMATVYKALDTTLEREVAIKIIRRSALPPDQLGHIMKRFEREAKTLAKLSHSNIVKVYDFGDYNGSPYLVLEYLPGGTLKERIITLNGAPIPWNEAVQTLLPIASALEFAHGQDMIHRDVKPSNILFDQNDQPMLSDFGIAKLLGSEETASLTSSGIGVGTPEYMAPEQWSGKVSAQSDLYSLGVVLYEMVTGKKPYEADTPAAILLKQATQPLPNPRKFSRALTGGCEEILIKALAPQPENRYPDMRTFSEALRSMDVPTKTNRTAPAMKRPTPPAKAPLQAAKSPIPAAKTPIPIAKTPIPATNEEIPAEAGDERTVDTLPVRKMPTKTSSPAKPVKATKTAPAKSRSLKGLWIALSSLAGLLVLALAGYLIYPKIKDLPLLSAPAATEPTPTLVEPAVLPTTAQVVVLPIPTPLPTAVPSQVIATNTPAVKPTLPRPTINRLTITIENGKNFDKLDEFSGNPINQIHWDIENRYLLVNVPSGINMYDAGNFNSVGSINPSAREVYLSFDGTELAFFATTRSLQVQNISTNTTISVIPIPPHNGSITSVVFSQDNSLIAVGMSTGAITVWTVADKTLFATFEAPETYVRTMAFSPDNTELAVGSGSNQNTDYSLRIWNLKTQVADHYVAAHQAPITFLFYFPDGDILASGSNDGYIYLWQVKDVMREQTLIKAFAANYLGGIESMAFSWDGSLLAYSIPYQQKHAILLTQANDGAVIKMITNLDGPIDNMYFSEDNTALATGFGSTVQIWGIP